MFKIITSNHCNIELCCPSRYRWAYRGREERTVFNVVYVVLYKWEFGGRKICSLVNGVWVLYTNSDGDDIDEDDDDYNNDDNYGSLGEADVHV